MTANGLDLSDDFTGRPGAAFVVGGSGGLGAAVVRELAARGSPVAFTFRRNEDAAAQLAITVSDLGRQAWTIGSIFATTKVARRPSTQSPTPVGYTRLSTPPGPRPPETPVEGDPTRCRNCSTPTHQASSPSSARTSHLRQTEGSIVATTKRIRRYPVRDGLSSVPKAAVEAAILGIAAEEGRFGAEPTPSAQGCSSTGWPNG